ncbi:MAG: M1 family aminopeptidase [Ignavibacteria bacterium]|jgi:aminopeptidase N
MKKISFLFPRLLLVCSLILFLQTLNFSQENPDRDKTYQVNHIKIEIKLDLIKKTVEGLTTTTIVPLKNNFHSFEVDAAGLEIKYVNFIEHSGQQVSLKYDYNKEELNIHLKHAFDSNYTLVYSIQYTAHDPEKGMYFISPDSLFPDKPYQVWTQGEGEDNHFWFPCYDFPNNKATTETIITLDGKYITLSNGQLLSVKTNTDGTKTWHWAEDKPYSSYLVMLAAGNFDIIEDRYDEVPVYSYIPVGEKDIAFKSFDKTADMVKFFTEKIGFNYPWGRYSQIVVKDFVYGGMENVSATVLTDALIYDEKAEPDYSAYGVVSHELSHQWWGDVVTCRNWNEIWLNESFATYFSALYDGYINGKDEFDYDIFKEGESAIKADSTTRRPIYTDEPLTANSYDKGSVVLNMLRNIRGERDFWKALNVYITDHQFDNVVTQDLIDAFYKVSIMDPTEDRKPVNMKWFFDEWIYKAGQPEYNAAYTYNKDSNLVYLTVYQQQKPDSLISIFREQVAVEVVTEKSKIEYQIVSDSLPKTYTLNIDAPMHSVIFNKGNRILCKLHFSKPEEDWLYQLEQSEDAIDRIDAVIGLKDFIDDEQTVRSLMKAMTTDGYWGVRSEAATMLGNSSLKDALNGITENYVSEQDSRVRRSMLLALGEIKQKHPDIGVTKALLDFVLNAIKTDSNYYIIADGINAISKIADKDGIYDLVAPFADMDSHAEIIRRNVAAALTESKDERAKYIFMKFAVKGKYPRLRTAAVRGLTDYLKDPDVIDFLNSLLSTKNRWVLSAIISEIEKAGSPSSKPYLEKLLKGTNDEDLKEILRKAISSIKSG